MWFKTVLGGVGGRDRFLLKISINTRFLPCFIFSCSVCLKPCTMGVVKKQSEKNQLAVLLPDHVLLYINEEAKKPDVSSTFLKKFENFIDWNKVIDCEIANESSVFLPAFLYFIDKIKLAKPWLNKKLKFHSKKDKELKCFETPLRFSLCDSDGKGIYIESDLMLQAKRQVDLTPQEMRYIEVIFAVYLALRLKDVKRRQKTLYIAVKSNLRKVLNYLNAFTDVKVYHSNYFPTIVKFRLDSYIGGFLDFCLNEVSPSSATMLEGFHIQYLLENNYMEQWITKAELENENGYREKTSCDVSLVHKSLLEKENRKNLAKYGDLSKFENKRFCFSTFYCYWDMEQLLPFLGNWLQKQVLSATTLTQFKSLDVKHHDILLLEDNYRDKGCIKLFESLDGEWFIVLKAKD